jgi:hypothetical protein
MLIDVEELKTLIKDHLPSIAAKNAGVQLLIKFVGKTVHAVNALDTRLKAVEASLKTEQPKD